MMTDLDMSASKLATIHIPRPIMQRQTTVLRPFPSHNTSIKSSETQVEQTPFRTVDFSIFRELANF